MAVDFDPPMKTMGRRTYTFFVSSEKIAVKLLYEREKPYDATAF